ncbi:hypothetical protein HMN09_00202000 [Mycena chlorophos]|uniref:Cytochrome P450 n=1 Tax=Mycena chlorophos TaxID=658473 RepID=A0A8H6TQ95_MYCCL|nr:hypothetical protein HMN09_00202000 [Mycena chlorophos]
MSLLDQSRAAAPFVLLSSVALSTPLILLFVFLFFVSDVKARKEHALTPGFEWMGRNSNEFFAAIRANFRGLVDSVALYRAGYAKYSKFDKIFVAPTWTKGPQIILPPSMGSWLASRPDDLLNAKDCTFDTAQFTYTVGHESITSNDMIDLLIKRELTRTTGTLNEQLCEEIVGSLEGLYGVDGEWRNVPVFDTLTRTVGRVANRIFVGKELCSNMDFVMAGTHFARDISVSSYILHLFPKFLKPAVSWFATIPNRRHSGIAMKYLKPLIKQRIEDMQMKAEDPNYSWEEPNDFITWMVRESFKRDTEDETSVYALAYRIVLLNFAAITTTTIMSTNALLDIWSAPNAEEIVASLREEAQRVLAEHNGVWSKAAVNKLHRLDSAIRESSRISGVGGTSMARRVRAANGVTLPNGVVVPKNATVGVAMDGLHFDEAFYPNPQTFDPWRFSRPREEAAEDEKAHIHAPKLVDTSVHFLPFSTGIHACPGRFFAANNIKLILAHILLDYEIQPFDHREPNISLGDISVVPVHAKMMIRRRVKA